MKLLILDMLTPCFQPPFPPTKSSVTQVDRLNRRRRSATSPLSHCRTSLPSTGGEQHIPVTDPRLIRALWRRVMAPSYSNPTQASDGRLRKRPGQNPANDKPTQASGEKRKGRPLAQILADDKPTTNSNERAWQMWRSNVLGPRDITVGPRKTRTAFDHFGYDEQAFLHWMSMHSFEAGKGDVWLSGGPEFNNRIATEYKEMKTMDLCEEEYASVAKEELLLRRIHHPIEGTPKKWGVERMIQLPTTPNSDENSKWVAPPLIGNSETQSYLFRLRPDCAYWLSLQAFSENHRDLVKNAAFTVMNRITCPYFTIEFKKTDTTFEQAWNQVVAASALALYNRYLLKKTRLEASEKPWTEDNSKSLRHYALTFTGATAIVWIVTPKFSPKSGSDSVWDWAGCNASELWESNCATPQGVRDLVDWINGIHRWGLEIHGQSCQDDIKVVLSQCGQGVKSRLSALFAPDPPVEASPPVEAGPVEADLPVEGDPPVEGNPDS